MNPRQEAVPRGQGSDGEHQGDRFPSEVTLKAIRERVLDDREGHVLFALTRGDALVDLVLKSVERRDRLRDAIRVDVKDPSPPPAGASPAHAREGTDAAIAVVARWAASS